MNSAIEQKANSITLSVSEQITETREYAEQQASTAESNANSATDNKLKAYSTTTEMNSAIEVVNNRIGLLVTETTNGDVINSASIIAAINNDGSTLKLDANKINLTAYAKTADVYDEAYSAAEDAIDGITLSTTNDTSSSTIRIRHNGVTISSASVSFSGMVTFDDLETEGATVINGSNITTGTLSADLIAANNDIYIQFAHPLQTDMVSGLEVLYFGEHGYIKKDDYGTSTPLTFYSYKNPRFLYNNPVVYLYNGSTYKDYEIINAYNIYDYVSSSGGGSAVAVFG